MKRNVKIMQKVKKNANIRNRYNQKPHWTWDTILESDKHKGTSHMKRLRGQLFPSRWSQSCKEQIGRYNKENIYNKNIPQKKHHFGTVSKSPLIAIFNGKSYAWQFAPHLHLIGMVGGSCSSVLFFGADLGRCYYYGELQQIPQEIFLVISLINWWHVLNCHLLVVILLRMAIIIDLVITLYSSTS